MKKMMAVNKKKRHFVSWDYMTSKEIADYPLIVVDGIVEEQSGILYPAGRAEYRGGPSDIGLGWLEKEGMDVGVVAVTGSAIEEILTKIPKEYTQSDLTIEESAVIHYLKLIRIIEEDCQFVDISFKEDVMIIEAYYTKEEDGYDKDE